MYTQERGHYKYQHCFHLPLPHAILIHHHLEQYIRSMSKKTVVSVDMLCSKCKIKVMKLLAGIEGINSVVLDSSKGLVTIVGEADPVQVIRKMRKYRKTATFVSIGPQKEEKKEEKKELESCLPRTCRKCDVWYVMSEEDRPYCWIL